MGRHSKRRVKQRAKHHQKLVKASHKMRKRRASRGLHAASVRRKKRATRGKLKTGSRVR